MHCTDGPARTRYTNGAICREEYYHEGDLHRMDGPAYTMYNEDGTVHQVRYFKYNKELPQEDFCGLEPGTPEFQFHMEMM